ncbi:hypothetical protein TNCV_1473411 [Trichonephila clavipes]|nr:hypothetical protein TNCV_1473411 [Trichonephila clavipes]
MKDIGDEPRNVELRSKGKDSICDDTPLTEPAHCARLNRFKTQRFSIAIRFDYDSAILQSTPGTNSRR